MPTIKRYFGGVHDGTDNLLDATNTELTPPRYSWTAVDTEPQNKNHVVPASVYEYQKTTVENWNTIWHYHRIASMTVEEAQSFVDPNNR